ncbi:hypothetical protein PHYSODRAFT_285907 [Phytophthora sojae]|uniref:RxLR effector protein n=2 Tax=Phytophthora sojae TaxID=67593 RepID=G4ZJ48_PHYSP|nr:hypothetical protein PHYSODRAFT_285907 [Phytophthora sojae]AEK81248.1 Avh360 [Phytophthora sojae]AEK81249.1 Avh360 [Phytophthora sojae]EGZ17295.1 hypothetical protein PHYSODRAFT_285907 [Phytophthora sojae]|eukprot:XP_009526353.1 hypothetical protein PHYSODRAFT_285907 [Phytophthora sojae]
MAPKLPQPPRFYCAMLLVVALACVYGVSTATNQTMGSQTPLHALGLDQSRIRVYRHLRAGEGASFEERLFENIPKLMEKLKPDKQKAANKYFAKLKLGKPTFNLFDDPAFQKFERFMAKSYKKTPDAVDAAMLSTLTTQYGDEAVAQMLVAARSSTLATKLEGVQFSNWIRQEKTADDVFKLMKLDQEADSILENPILKRTL